MRVFVAAALLLFQLQPVLGVALCSAMGVTDSGQLEAGCPMPESESGNGPFHTEGWSSPTTSHDCVFAEACTPSSTTVPAVRLAVASRPPEFNPPCRLVDFLLPAESRSPPVPPPRS